MIKIITYIRSPFLVIFYILWTALNCISAILLCRILSYKALGEHIRIWAKGMIYFSGIKLKVTGLNNIPKKKGVLFLVNHMSLLDIPVFHTAIPNSARFGAKSELFKIPIFGSTLKALSILAIQRQDREKTIEVYKNAQMRLDSGESFVLAPEGTRQFKPEIGNFKTGPFVFAIESKATIVPVVISGADKVLPNKSMMINTENIFSVVRVEILKPISTQKLTYEDREALRDKVRLEMKTAYDINASQN